MSARIAGGCHCGACRYETEAEPINVRACHCRACQKVSGGPFYARVLVPAERVRISGPVGWYASSADLRRGFCTRCGAIATRTTRTTTTTTIATTTTITTTIRKRGV